MAYYNDCLAVTTLNISNCLQSSFFDGKLILSHLTSFIKSLVFVILSGVFPISSGFNSTVIERIYYLFY